MNPNAVGTPEDADAGKAMITRAGTVSYSAPTGERINLNYVAGDKGFVPTGDHLPTPPSDTKEVADAKVAFQIAYDAAAKAAAEAPEFPASQSNNGAYGYAQAPAAPVRSTY
ncbi:unnamed protein product [Allacma fusca]|uniref:Uncharacterized protein n=1 Tax=Allacma fusca TaxID=39272 RepID=A0A8J2PQD5_9HEXA|nr:unnamed protein product [Allacma fusca]